MGARYDEVLTEVRQLLAGAAKKDEASITEDTVLARDLDLDSLAVMDVLMALEDKFDVSIPINHLPDIETVRDLTSTIERIVGERDAGAA
jgi:acyl carrier protein